jgi:hypothetical protein
MQWGARPISSILEVDVLRLCLKGQQGEDDENDDEEIVATGNCLSGRSQPDPNLTRLGWRTT